MPSQLTYLWKEPKAPRNYRSAVSLHGHTNHSRERLYFIEEYAKRNPVLRAPLSTQTKRAKTKYAITVDSANAHLTPPLWPRAALELERDQIQRVLSILPMVSLTDHDNIEAAPKRLRILPGGRVFPSRSSGPFLTRTRFPPGNSQFAERRGGSDHGASRGLYEELSPTAVPQSADRTDSHIEENIHILAEIEHELLKSGFADFLSSIVGQGREERWLRDNMRRANFAGVLRGEALARAYANMDVFVSVAHGYIWKCGPRGACMWSSGHRYGPRRASIHCAPR